MIPKMGNVLPRRAKQQDVSYSEIISRALRVELGDSHRALKTIMAWTGVSERTAKNWYSGAAGPNGGHLIELVRHSDSVYEAFFDRAERQQAVSARKLLRSRVIIGDFLAHLDGLVQMPGDHQ